MKTIQAWGKFEKDDYHHLFHHCADVAACFEAIANIPVIRNRMECSARSRLSDIQISRLAVLAFLHDAGKLHPGFQSKAWDPGIWSGNRHGHVQEGAAIFFGDTIKEIKKNLLVSDIAKWQGDELLFSAFAHHGRPFKIERHASKEWHDIPSIGYKPIELTIKMGELIRQWYPQAFDENEKNPLPDTPDFQHLFCGLVSLADWIGSTKTFFDFASDLDEQYIIKARQKASYAISSIGLDVNKFRIITQGRSDFETITNGQKPRQQQALIGGLSLEEQLVILESETGSGKTEAAIWRFAQLFEAGMVDGLYFALPTRAAAIQIHRRVTEIMSRLFNGGEPEPVMVVPGYLKAGAAKGQRLSGWHVHWDDDDGMDEKRLLSRWAAESDKRSLAAAIAIGTVDQAMLAGLQVKHAHLRSAALSKSFLVIDEVHASDRYMSEIQNHLLKTHLERGGYAMLMSATLGSAARTKWLGQKHDPTFDEAVQAPYPAIWVKSHENPISCLTTTAQKSVQMELIQSMEGSVAAQIAIKAARKGARVLVIRNTVTAAVKTFEPVLEECPHLLLHAAGKPCLHHSRFAGEDRALLDRTVEEALSPKKRKSGGIIVIGTQTLEQSLDIDADLLITDLCPIDVLLQRIGRLHRHQIDRPSGYETPECYVMSPSNGLAKLLKPEFENGLGSWKGPGGFNGIYQDLSGLELTRRLVENHNKWVIPSMNRMLVESATHPKMIGKINDELGQEWKNYWNNIYGKTIAEAISANNIKLQTKNNFSETMFPEANEELIRTRLGSEGAKIKFSKTIESPFGNKIDYMAIPSHWSYSINSLEDINVNILNDGFSFNIGEFTFVYKKTGLIRAK